MNSENTNNVSLQAVLLTMMLEKIDNLSNRVNEMQIASGDIKEACDKLNDRIGAFEEKFEQVLQHQSSEPDQPTATPIETNEEKENASQHLNKSKILESKFVKKDDEWDCQICYVRNHLSDDNCLSCDTAKDGKEEATPAPAFKPTTFSSTNTSYSFGLNKSFTPPTDMLAVAVAPSSVKTKAQTDNSKPAETKRLFGDKPFSLASPQPAAPSAVKTQAQTVDSKPAGTKSLFGNKPFSFAPPPQPAVATSLFVTQPEESPFGAKPATDESQPKSLFGGTGFSNANKTPLSFSSIASGTNFLDKKIADTPKDVFGARTSSTFAKQSATEENENPEEYVPDAQYEPVIPLPDKVDVVTGEESEQILFKNRCKLYIFNSETKEIKERGVGDIKVLYNPDKKNYRVVMRREQVHKICANFRITKNMNIADKTGTKGCGIFSCIDFSENSQEGTSTVFYARFREENVYGEFKKLFNEIAEGYHVPSGIPSTNAGESSA
uniref:Uncharacterized protein n=1 Tax=Panagrolaimus sp. PS1159 TaxID=55785 RepID=A0AC35G950_9BILA